MMCCDARAEIFKNRCAQAQALSGPPTNKQGARRGAALALNVGAGMRTGPGEKRAPLSLRKESECGPSGAAKQIKVQDVMGEQWGKLRY
jgi:hypothetical protein